MSLGSSEKILSLAKQYPDEFRDLVMEINERLEIIQRHFDGIYSEHGDKYISHTDMLDGLDADDHPALLPRSGVRAMSNNLNLGGFSLKNIRILERVFNLDDNILIALYDDENLLVNYALLVGGAQSEGDETTEGGIIFVPGEDEHEGEIIVSLQIVSSDETATRALDTDYQNFGEYTNKLIVITVKLPAHSYVEFYSDANTSPTTLVAKTSNFAMTFEDFVNYADVDAEHFAEDIYKYDEWGEWEYLEQTITVLVSPEHYYRLSSGIFGEPEIIKWMEYNF